MSASRHRRSRAPRTKRPRVRRCAICTSSKNVQGNHIGGKYHLAWITIPFCGECHSRFHTRARQAGLVLEWTDDPIERLRRALAFIEICVWMLLEQMKKEIQAYRERGTQSGEIRR
jgi:hypothetical protein